MNREQNAWGVLSFVAVAFAIVAVTAFFLGYQSAQWDFDKKTCETLGGHLDKADQLGTICVKGDKIVLRL